jgi:CRISPR-associated protein Csd1
LSWIQKLYETYDRCAGQPQFDTNPLPPISVRPQNTQICITLNGKGDFRYAEVSLLEDTLIPVSEASAARSGRSPAANPLADKLAYCAGDGSKYGLKRDYFDRLCKELSDWCESEHRDAKASIVLEYIKRGTLIADLLKTGTLTLKDEKLERLKIKGKALDPSQAWIRWRVETKDEMVANTWEDPNTFYRWERFESGKPYTPTLCISSGTKGRVARLHPKSIRDSGDQAKLISSDDDEGYTFKGRFLSAEQAASLGYVASQKAHSALRWLLARQGYRNADQAIVAWAVAGSPIPRVVAGSDQIRQIETTDDVPSISEQVDTSQTVRLPKGYKGDAGQLFARQLNRLLRGYHSALKDRDDVVVMALDSATPGRMAIIYYRELQASEFLDRIRGWHENTAWILDLGKGRQFIGAPSPEDIARGVYGARLMYEITDGVKKPSKLRKATVQRLLPCIVDARPIPRDLVETCFQRVTRRVGLERSKNGHEEEEFEYCLGVACALVRGSRREENYSMSLEEDRNSRDYLFGRLLAIAEKIEGYALYLAKETRGTTAERLMQRFSDHPSATWRTIELALRPYMQRLQGSRPAALYVWKSLLDDVISRFQGDDFTRPGRLDAEFLLGYHCQRAALRWDESKSETKEESSQEPQLV